MEDSNVADLPPDNVKYINQLKRKITEVENIRNQNLRTSYLTTTNFDLSKNERLWQMKQEQQYIDAVIITQDGHQEAVHLDQLLAIKSMIKNCFKFLRDVSPTIKEFEIDPSVNADVLKELVYFAYHRRCTLNQLISLQMADFANKYMVTPLLDYTLEYLVQNCNIFNAIRGFELCSSWQRSSKLFFKKFIEDNFEIIIKQNRKDLLSLEFKFILDLLKSAKLNLINEEIVWFVIEDWVAFEKDSRAIYLEVFLKESLRIGRLRENFIKKNIFASEVFLTQSSDVQLKIQTFVDKLLNESRLIIKDGNGLLYSNSNIYFQPRETKEVLIAAGGWVEGQTTSSIEIYDYQTNFWIPSFLKLPKKISYFGLQIIDNVIYIFGGSNGREIFKTLETLDLTKSNCKWEKKCSMIESRCYVSSVVLDGKIYSIGGFNQRHRIRKCECYHPELDGWREIADLNYPRSDASAEVFDGRIFIAGGINDSCVERSVEVYYPELNQWRLIKSMNSPRTSFSLSVFQNKIWALGGNDGNKRSKSCECYDLESNTWTEMPEMLSRRSTFRSVVLNDELYAIGGYNGQSPICNVEKFVPGKEWIRVRELKHDRSGLSLLRVPNIFELIKI